MFVIRCCQKTTSQNAKKRGENALVVRVELLAGVDAPEHHSKAIHVGPLVERLAQHDLRSGTAHVATLLFRDLFGRNADKQEVPLERACEGFRP